MDEKELKKEYLKYSKEELIDMLLKAKKQKHVLVTSKDSYIEVSPSRRDYVYYNNDENYILSIS